MSLCRFYRRRPVRIHLPVLFLLLLSPSGCGNSPYLAGEPAQPILYTAISDDPRTLDPSVGYNATTDGIICPIYPSYLEYNYLKRDPFVLQPGLGASLPTRTPYHFLDAHTTPPTPRTGEIWTFHLKPGLRFQDDPCFPHGQGRAITAADFLYSFRRMADPAINCPILSYFDDKVLGMAAYEAYNGDREKRHLAPDYTYALAGLQPDAHDPLTFRIVLTQPYPQLRYLMAMHFTSPLPHEAVERYGAGFAEHPVGSGPYVLWRYRHKGEIVLRANPNYRVETYPVSGSAGDREAGLLSDAGQRLPLVKEIHIGIIREGITAWNLFQQGYLDAATVTQDNYGQVMSQPGDLTETMRRRGVRLRRTVGLDFNYLCFNMEDPTFGGYTEPRRKLRQAISLAIDSQAYIDLLALGIGKQAQWLVPPGLFGYDASYQNPYRQYNLQRARALLAEAGYAGGIDPKTGSRLTLYFDNMATTPAGRQGVGIIVKQIEALGIHVESRGFRYSVFEDHIHRGQFQLMNYNWYADYPDPENFVCLIYGPNRPPGGPNYARYAVPEYDALFQKMRVMDDGPERLALIRRLRDIAQEDCPYIYLVHSENYGVMQPWFHNYRPNPIVMDAVKYYRIDGAQRARLQAAWNRPNYWPALGALIFVMLGSLPAAAVVRRRMHRHMRRADGNRYDETANGFGA